MTRVWILALTGLMIAAAGCGGGADDITSAPPNGLQQDATVAADRDETASLATATDPITADQADAAPTSEVLPSTAGPLPLAAAVGGVSLLMAALLRARRLRAGTRSLSDSQ